jgi:hypothetical protein
MAGRVGAAAGERTAAARAGRRSAMRRTETGTRIVGTVEWVCTKKRREEKRENESIYAVDHVLFIAVAAQHEMSSHVTVHKS